MKTFSKWYYRFLLVIAPVLIVTGVVGYFTSASFWKSTWYVFMGIAFLVFVFIKPKTITS